MATTRSQRQQAAGRRRASARIRMLVEAGRSRLGAGLQYWQAGGSTRSAVKRAKRG